MLLRKYSVKDKEGSCRSEVMLNCKQYSGLLLCWAVIATVLFVRQSLNIQSVTDTASSNLRQPKCPYIWHGGSPTHNGSCWCGNDGYCMCTPSVAIDAVMEVESNDKDVHIVLVRRKDAPRDKHAIVGGFVEVGEAVEDAVWREVKEETNLDVTDLQLFDIYSDPQRDARRHTVSVVYRGLIKDTSGMKVGDDAKRVEVIRLRDAMTLLDLAFDHKQILTDYIKTYHPELWGEIR